MSVVDASVAVNALVSGTLQEQSRLRLGDVEAVAPTLIEVEVLSALARLERAGRLGRHAATDAVAKWTELPVELIHREELAPLVWSLRGSLRIADAYYVALALTLDAPLLTADRRLATAPVSGLTVLLVQ